MALLMESAFPIRAAWVTTPDELSTSIRRTGEFGAVVVEASAVPWDVPAVIADVRAALPSVRIVGTHPTGQARHREMPDVTSVSRGATSTVLGAAVLGRAPGVLPGGEHPGGVSPRRADTLTRREFQVLALISAGMTTAQIADRLGISAKTVEGKRQTLYSKLGVQSQSSAVSVAIRTGLLGAGVTSPGPPAT
jgi:DNA-binding CsgD family transcriptional regulator